MSKLISYLTMAIKVEQTIVAYKAYRAGGHEAAEAVLLAVQQTGLFPV